MRSADRLKPLPRLAIRGLLILAGAGLFADPAGAVSGRVKGTIRDEAGDLLAGVPVRLYAVEDGKKRIFVTHTDSRGRYRFDSLEAGTYELEVGGERFGTQRKDQIVVRPPFRNVIDLSVGFAPEGAPSIRPPFWTPFSTPAAGTGPDLSGTGPRVPGLVPAAAFRPGGEITGRIGGILRDGNGNAVPDARILLRGADRAWRAVSGADGSFSLEEIPAGPYRLEVNSPGYLSIRIAPVTIDGISDLDFRLTLVEYPLDFEEKVEDLLPPERPLPPAS